MEGPNRPSAHDMAIKQAIMEAPFLEIRDIYKHFGGVKALNGVSLTLRKGEIHCLAGENGCGKSTLIKIISGYYHKDSGEIVVEDNNIDPMTPKIAISKGIQVVYQDLSLYPSMTVAENIVLADQIQNKRHIVNWKAVREQARAALSKIAVDTDVDEAVSSLPIAKKQLVSIAKALHQDAKLVILDEPTTSLTEREIDILFTVLRNLADKGMSVLLVSHKLREVLRISTRLTIMRNGLIVTSGATSEFTESSIGKFMTGREVEKKPNAMRFDRQGVPYLQVKNLSKQHCFSNVSMDFYPGEIVGITGLLGSGRSEVARAIVGLERFDSGEVLVEGKPVKLDSIDKAISAGVGYVPEDRISEGLFLEQSVKLNMISSSMQYLIKNKLGTMDFAKIREKVDSTAEQFNIVMKDREVNIKYLSGGNAQKVMLGRWLLANVKLLFLNGPTVGVDIGAKFEIYEKLRVLSEQGMMLVIISDDVPELALNCSRIIVLHKGAVVKELKDEQVTEDSINAALASLM
ncbi:MAG: sugar ABC transporter ATP-binding protein [Sphaerochaetaceae bacterium]|nr:sugar ABC transporter ATP-binding protein [Sphaerochaetaceae bacterium]